MDLMALGVSFIESWMKDSCVITRQARGPWEATLDEDTFQLEYDTPVSVYSGKCLVSRILTRDKDVVQGAFPAFVNNYKLLLPNADSVDVRLGDTVTVSSTDGRLDGSEFRITDVEKSTHQTYRRLHMIDVEDSVASEGSATT